MKYVVLVLIVVLLVPSPVTAQDDGIFFEEVTCSEVVPFLDDSDDKYCGYLIVPEDHNDPASLEVEIAVVVLQAFSDNPQRDPIIYLEGGPGGAGIFTVDAWINHPLRQNRDIILFDQRGTGFSYPNLGCWEAFDEAYEDETEAFAACRTRLIEEEQVNLSLYNSVQSAADVDALRAELGYDQVNLLGISYGTRLALTVMRYHPDGVRSAVIDGVYPPHLNAYEVQAVTLSDAILVLFAACQADADCNSAYPDLENTFYALVDSLNETPLEIEVEDESGELVLEEFFGEDLVSMLGDKLYDTAVIPYLPRMIYELSQGNDETYFAIVNEEIGEIEPEVAGVDYEVLDEFSDLSDSDGLHLSVECNEEVFFSNLDTAFSNIEPYADQLELSLIFEVEDVFIQCEMWAVDGAPDIENTPVLSDIPTLVLSGQFDPVTPSAWGFSAAETLSHSFAYEFPGVGHGSIYAGECPVSILLAFIDNPTAEPDSSCIGAMGVRFE